MPTLPKAVPAAASKSRRTVIVASKVDVPIQLQLQVKQERQFQNQGMRWTEAQSIFVGQIVYVRGTSYPRGQVPEGFRSPPEMVHGYALTRGVDAEFWEKWEEQNQGFAPVASGILFAAETMDEVRSRAREGKDLRSGLEPIKQPPKDGQSVAPSDRDPRWPSVTSGLRITGEPGPTDLD